MNNIFAGQYWIPKDKSKRTGVYKNGVLVKVPFLSWVIVNNDKRQDKIMRKDTLLTNYEYSHYIPTHIEMG